MVNDKQSTLFPSTPCTPSTQCTPKTSKPSDSLNVLVGLCRAEVEPLVAKILQVIQPFCDRVEVAGSFRRLRTVVNDLDIVVQLKPMPYYWIRMLKAIREGFVVVTEKQGDKLATLYLPVLTDSKGSGHFQVDIYRAEPQTWGILLLVRTGSKEHNVKLCNLAISKGLRLQYSVGLTDQTGHVIAGWSEEEVFTALGLAYVEPKDREVL